MKQGINELPCIGDGRQSGTSASPSILNASPEAAVGGNLFETGDQIRIDLNTRRVDVLISDEELAARKAKLEIKLPPNQTPSQELFRLHVASYRPARCSSLR